MLDCAMDNEMFVLLEVFEESDLERATGISQRARIREQAEKQKFLIGVNTRDLRTLAVDNTRLQKYGPLLPGDITAVAESGLLIPRDAERVVEWGYQVALVGTALMRADAPAELIREMLEAGREKEAA
jgi:indole-3-glycerol phosphate synthase